MKTTFSILAALLLAGSAAQAQVTPTSPQRSGVGNQTTLPPVNPTTPNNPGTISQQSADQLPTMQQNTNLDVNVAPNQTTTRRDGSYLPAGRVPTPSATDRTTPAAAADRPLRPRANTGRRGTSPTQTVTPQR